MTGTQARTASGRATRARQANDPTVTIADFSFTPPSITIHVGDVIQWTNNGPSDHTATANNGSFDTGVLKKGHSASVTFHLPGTFDYHCSIHPFMHGAVVVLSNAKTPPPSSPSSPSSSGPSSSGSPSGSSSAGSSSGSSSNSSSPSKDGQGSLPFTGLNLWASLLLGVALTGTGLLLRRLRRRLD